MEPTIRDVARQANVSIKTVSRVLNNSPNVQGRTRRRVQEAMRALGYSPNPAARTLRSGLKMAIGVFIAHNADLVFSNPFFAQVLRGIGYSANKAGFRVALTYASEVSGGDRAGERAVDGLVLMSVGARDSLLTTLHERGIPFVLTCRHELDIDVPVVETDNVRGASQAVDHLLRLGHRRIAFLGGAAELRASQERLAGYRQALAAAGVDSSPELVTFGEYSEEAGLLWGSHLLGLPSPPTALFAAGDVLAVGAIEAARRRGMRVPSDLSVVGFDDISFARYLQPPLTTVNQNGFQKGVIAGEMLVSLILKQPLSPRQFVIEPELVIRQSTAPPGEERA